MPGLSRIGDKCSGHGCYPPRIGITSSSNVFINNKGAHTQGDEWEEHYCGSSHHNATSTGGSSTVYVNGKPAVRIGDPLSCGSVVAMGSGNVFGS